MINSCIPNLNGGYVEENVLTALFQADSLIACHSVSNLNDMIYGNDSDYLVFLDSQCQMLWDMKQSKGTTDLQVEMYGACNVKMVKLCS